MIRLNSEKNNTNLRKKRFSRNLKISLMAGRHLFCFVCLALNIIAVALIIHMMVHP